MQINGSLKTESWLDKQGKRQYTMVVGVTACWMIRQASIPKSVGA